MVRVLEPEAQLNVWKVRKAALPLLLGLPGDKKPIAFVEDTAVVLATTRFPGNGGTMSWSAATFLVC